MKKASRLLDSYLNPTYDLSEIEYYFVGRYFPELMSKISV